MLIYFSNVYRLSLLDHTRSIVIREETEYEEVIGVKREWLYPLRKNSSSKNNETPTISGSSTSVQRNNGSFTNSLPHSSKRGSSKTRSKSNKYKPPNGYPGSS